MKHPFEGPNLATELIAHNLIGPEEFVDWERVCELGEKHTWVPISLSSSEWIPEIRDPSTLIFWLEANQTIALDYLKSHLGSCELGDLARLGHAACVSIQVWFSASQKVRPHHPATYKARGEEFAAAMQGVFQRVYERKEALPREEQSNLAPLSIRLFCMAYDEREQEAPEPVRKAIAAGADRELGRLRGDIRTLSPDEGAELFTSKAWEFRAAATTLFRVSTLWAGLRPLLLLFRAIPVPAVGDDLRWWDDDSLGPAVPKPWSEVISRLVYSFHPNAKREQESDKDLLALRKSFAKYCLDRLKTRKGEPRGGGNDSRVEPDPHWRVAYIFALRELSVNPSGKGHKVLHAAAEEDPDEEVKKAAKAVYPIIRGGKKLADNPRRAVLKATWWLRQGHLLSFGHKIDEVGARVTEEKEIHMTTEAAH